VTDLLGPYALGQVHHADCRDGLAALPAESCDAIMTDPPFGVTCNEWDEPVDWRPWFRAAWRALRPGAPIVALVNFDTACEMRCASDKFRYEIVCPHNLPTGHLNAKIRPMVAHLFIVVFCRETPPWFPQYETGPASHVRRSAKFSSGTTYGKHERPATVIDGRKWPTTVHPFEQVHPSIREHASEKPVPLAEWVLQSYTEPGAIVCDPFAGSGWLACAAVRTGRKSIGFDSDPASVALANRRIAAEHERLGDVRPEDAKTNQQIGLLRRDERQSDGDGGQLRPEGDGKSAGEL
jgi:DNA modification methylase